MRKLKWSEIFGLILTLDIVNSNIHAKISRLTPKRTEIGFITFKLIEGKIETRVKKRKEYKKQRRKENRKSRRGRKNKLAYHKQTQMSDYHRCKWMELTGWKTKTVRLDFFKKQLETITRAKEGWTQKAEKVIHKH